MYLSCREVAARYHVDIASVWRWAKDPTSPFPLPLYFGENKGTGRGKARLGAIARWRAYDLMMYEVYQQIDQDEIHPERAGAKRGALMAMLRREFPELDRAPEGFELQARQAHAAEQAAYRPAFLGPM